MAPGRGMMEKRTDQRHAVEEAAVMRIDGVAGGVYVVTVLDVSKSGLRVSCPITLEFGTRVKVICHGAEISGEIRYHRDVGVDGYYLGVRVDAVARDGRVQDGDFDLTSLFRLR